MARFLKVNILLFQNLTLCSKQVLPETQRVLTNNFCFVNGIFNKTVDSKSFAHCNFGLQQICCYYCCVIFMKRQMHTTTTMQKLLKVLILCVFIVAISACNQRYWFRKKATIYEDTTRVEKNFQIVW